MTPLGVDSLGTIVAAAGALGTACFGVIEALKWTPLGESGYGQIPRYLGSDLLGALRIAYGTQYERLLRAQYREDSQQQTGIAKALRQGVRIGLTASNAEAVAVYLGSVPPQALKKAVEAAATNSDGTATLSSDDRGALGRFELAVDARIDSALSRAKDVYLGTIRVTASLLAIAIAEGVAAVLGDASHLSQIGALLVGIVAVPLAPVANDVVAALQAATKALRS
jgi:hypothetical protein